MYPQKYILSLRNITWNMSKQIQFYLEDYFTYKNCTKYHNHAFGL